MVPPSTELLPSAAPSSVHHFVATPCLAKKTPDAGAGWRLAPIATMGYQRTAACGMKRATGRVCMPPRLAANVIFGAEFSLVASLHLTARGPASLNRAGHPSDSTITPLSCTAAEPHRTGQLSMLNPCGPASLESKRCPPLPSCHYPCQINSLFQRFNNSSIRKI